MRLTQLLSKERLYERIEDTLDDLSTLKLIDKYNVADDAGAITDSVWDLLGELDTEDVGLEESEDDGEI